MKILHLSDLHIKLSGPRAGECRRILEWIPEHVPEIEPDAIVISGDIFDRRSLPEERLFLASFLENLSFKTPTYLINGNHDDIEDLRLFHQWGSMIEVITGPEVKKVRDLTLAFLPWPQLAGLAATAPGASIADRKEIAKAALLDILRGFKVPAGAPSLLVAHIPVLGASMDSGQPVSGGEEIALSADDLLSCNVAGIALGHIHLRQPMRSGDGRPVWYAGAPFRTNFGESAGAKGGLIWDWIGGAWRVTPWDVPAKPMLLLEGTPWDGDIPDVAGAEVRLRFSFAAEGRETADRAAEIARDRMLAAGAESVTLDPRPILVSRMRCADIVAARTTSDKLKAWAQATGQEIPGGIEARLAELEAGGAS